MIAAALKRRTSGVGMSHRIQAFAVVSTAAVLFAGAALGQPTPVAPPVASADGAALFDQNCSACHQPTGKGIPGAFPALAGDPFVVGPAAAPASVVLNGRGGMPTFGKDLTDEQIAAILTYVRSSWGNHAVAVTPGVIQAARNAGNQVQQGGALQAH